jgi:carboxypeptidase Taq
MATEELYAEYKDTMWKIADIRTAAALMQWDQETYMPKDGGEMRGKQLATIQELAHSLFIDPNFGELLEKLLLKNDLPMMDRRNVELTFYDYTKASKLPSAFVRKLSEAVSKSFHAWMMARETNSFVHFSEPLDELIKLKREEASYLGYEDHPYDALLNDHERGLTVKMLDHLFSSLIPELSALLEKIRSAKQVDDSFLLQHFDKDAQWQFGVEVLKHIGFDFNAGRQDLSEHPFSTSFHNKDVRVTTRIDDQNFGSMTWSCIHEGGHALYEQGLLREQYGLPLGEACSYSMHESQSRLWENCIGRGLPFWKFFYPKLIERFKQQFGQINVETFYAGINKVQPSLIRTEADEITYHFHVLIRYELEKKLIDGSLSAKDIPRWWNEQYYHYLGVVVPDDRQGALQDVHWSHGSFGYFPTYSLGSLYAAQFFAAIEHEIPTLDTQLEKGNTALVLQWLRQQVHLYGRYYTAEELCNKATGENLDTKHFLTYLQKKYNSIYIQ